MVPVKLATLHRYVSDLLVDRPAASEKLDDYVEGVMTGDHPHRLLDFLRGLHFGGCWDFDRDEDIFDLYVAAFPEVL